MNLAKVVAIGAGCLSSASSIFVEFYFRQDIKFVEPFATLKDYSFKKQVQNLYHCQKKVKVSFSHCKDNCFLLLQSGNCFYKLELDCSSIQVTLIESQFDNDFIYQTQIQSNITVEDIWKFAKRNYLTFDKLSDCSQFNYDIIKEYGRTSPQHTPEKQEIITKIYFCVRTIANTLVIDHGYLVVESQNKKWICEIGGDREQKISLQFQLLVKTNTQFRESFTDLKKGTTFGQIVNYSYDNWANKKYKTLLNNCFDYCYSIIKQFTMDKNFIKFWVERFKSQFYPSILQQKQLIE